MENVVSLFEVSNEVEEPLKFIGPTIEHPPILKEMLTWPPLYQKSNQVIFPKEIVDSLAFSPSKDCILFSDYKGIYVFDPLSM